MKTYNWEGVNPDGYFLDKLEPIPSALPSFQKLFQVSATALSKIGRAVQQECRDRKSGSAGMPRPISYAVFCLKKKINRLAVCRADGVDLFLVLADGIDVLAGQHVRAAAPRGRGRRVMAGNRPRA